jgi:predicted RNA-binding protein
MPARRAIWTVPYSGQEHDSRLEATVMTEQPQYWVIVGSPENLAKTREIGFTIQGIKSRHRKKAEQMRPGDKFVYYITGEKAFAGIVTVTSPYRESHGRIWASGDPKKAAEDYPYRLDIKPDLVLEEANFVDAEPIARQMEYAKKWPAANWTLAFQGNVHFIPEGDYEIIRKAIESAAGK